MSTTIKQFLGRNSYAYFHILYAEITLRNINVYKYPHLFLQVVSSAIVDKYIGESARLIREMFAFARDHEPCIIFMDEIDAIGGYFYNNN